MSGAQLSRNEVVSMLLRISFVSVVTYYSVKWMINQIDPTSKNKKKAKEKAEVLLKRSLLHNIIDWFHYFLCFKNFWIMKLFS